jgi:PhnB protein
MTTHILPYLHFGGNCREAMTFYHECLGGDLAMQTVGESPMAAQMPAEVQQQIMHASLMRGEVRLMASDMMQEPPARGNTISLMLYCTSEAEIRDYFSKLSAGGTVNFPLGQQFWGATYGELTDKFGINWLLNYDNPRE